MLHTSSVAVNQVMMAGITLSNRQFYHKEILVKFSSNGNLISHVMVTVHTSSVVDSRFDPQSRKPRIMTLVLADPPLKTKH
jgi:hypothetical protein